MYEYQNVFGIIFALSTPCRIGQKIARGKQGGSPHPGWCPITSKAPCSFVPPPHCSVCSPSPAATVLHRYLIYQSLVSAIPDPQSSYLSSFSFLNFYLGTKSFCLSTTWVVVKEKFLGAFHMYISCLFNCFVRSLVSKCYSLIHLFVCVLGFLCGSGDKKAGKKQSHLLRHK